MWTNVATPGWSSMIIKPQFTHTRLRCRPATQWSNVPYALFSVGSMMLILAVSGDSEAPGSFARLVGLALLWLAIALPLVGGRFWLGNPEVMVDAAGLTIQNLWRTTRIAWRDVERLDLAGYAGITVKTAHQEILCAGLRCSAVEWLPIGRDARRRARWELGLVRDWLDHCRIDAVSRADV
jgi:Bacterial PH domain